MAQKTVTRVKRKEKKNIVNAVAHINATFNNTIITISDEAGNTISSGSGGCVGFKGAGRETAIRSLQTVGFVVTSISDETPLPHNGCRPPKARRN